MIINEHDKLVSLEQPQEVSVSICAFAKSDPNTDAYSLTIAYPSINKERDDGSTYTFSQAAPAGRRNLFRTLRTGERWESETVLTSSSYQNPAKITRRRGGGGRGGGGGGRGGKGGGGGGSDLSTGAIVGICIGVVALVLMGIAIKVFISRREKKKNMDDEIDSIRSFPYEATETRAAPIPFTPKTLYNPPVTGAPPNKRTTERDTTRRQMDIGYSPSTYRETYRKPTHSDARLCPQDATRDSDLSVRDRSMERTSESNDETALLRQCVGGSNSQMDRRLSS
jgi:hypothetical protein